MILLMFFVLLYTLFLDVLFDGKPSSVLDFIERMRAPSRRAYAPKKRKGRDW